jgi:hypothetical protein
MNKIKSTFILYSFCLICLQSYTLMGQSIFHSWLSEVTNSYSCIEFDSVSHTMYISGLYGEWKKKGYGRCTFKAKKNNLKIKWYNNQTIFGNQHSTYLVEISQLTSDQLILTFLKCKDEGLIEVFGGNRVVFKKSEISCEENELKKSTK